MNFYLIHVYSDNEEPPFDLNIGYTYGTLQGGPTTPPSLPLSPRDPPSAGSSVPVNEEVPYMYVQLGNAKHIIIKSTPRNSNDSI